MSPEKNYGLLAAIDWNTNNWSGLSSPEDLEKSDFKAVEEGEIISSSLNFGHLQYASETDEYYYGLLPQLLTKTLDRDKSLHLKIVFLKSKDFNTGKLYIVGFYSFPVFVRGKRPSPLPDSDVDFTYNIKAKPADIHLVENFVDISDAALQKKIIPGGKKIGPQAFNYLPKQQVFNVLDAMTKLNPDDKRLHAIKLRLLRAIV
ncbi:MAG: hypothetical protein EOP49_02265 [Sphingobacteriales bacterium]|nr:MAG: hypothetical protein EOP49_02265 [Sphingobacteriales bacterium]